NLFVWSFPDWDSNANELAVTADGFEFLNPLNVVVMLNDEPVFSYGLLIPPPEGGSCVDIPIAADPGTAVQISATLMGGDTNGDDFEPDGIVTSFEENGLINIDGSEIDNLFNGLDPTSDLGYFVLNSLTSGGEVFWALNDGSQASHQNPTTFLVGLE